jgi:hypothetical protein
MRRIAHLTAVTALVAFATIHTASAQGGLPPQAWLFGAWIGGIFPPPSSLGAQECLGQPVVIFTRDIVMRAVITDQTYAQRLVETARTTGQGVEFRFAPSLSMTQAAPFSTSVPMGGAVGFGCQNPDILHVQRRSENEISFPDCADFPYPLVRCPAR